MSLSTHVLDTVRGEPASGVPVRLERERDGQWAAVATGSTDQDGRLRDWVPPHAWATGVYRLVFGTDGPFFPEVVVVFRVTDPLRHHHIPLLLGPYGYTTYRGS
ncbi:MAG TPA: hydroxyisourate hydrolase [Micromonosporaceae bacterium]|jgi:5-hydroxyisourate hydrolase|nr:hydroxyisourate hydrolase [Micromonosporaceae bacterium]